MRLIVTLGALFAVVGCSTAPTAQYSDPLEPFNRRVFAFNDAVDRAVIVPATKVYVWVLPDLAEEGVQNFFSNVGEPLSALNHLLQGEPGTAFEGIGRFSVNSTLGILGVFDVATGMGLSTDREDLGQTFARWGVGSGPYVILPFLGGGTLRDSIGRAATGPASPAAWLADDEAQLGFIVGNLLNGSAQALEARNLVTGDRYLFVRDAYFQRRQFLIDDGATQQTDPFLDE